jgi:hypothetical protein
MIYILLIINYWYKLIIQICIENKIKYGMFSLVLINSSLKIIVEIMGSITLYYLSIQH